MRLEISQNAPEATRPAEDLSVLARSANASLDRPGPLAPEVVPGLEDGFEASRQIETTEFKAWFGDSKVVDEGGLPKVIFHGGTFDELEDPVPEVGAQGFHFGTESAAREREYGKLVDDFMLDLKVEQDETNQRWYWSSLGEDSGDILSDEGFETEEKARVSGELYATTYADGMIQSQEEQPITQAYLRILNPKRVPDQEGDWREAVARAKAEGHDGLVYQNRFEDKGHDSWVVFEPTQIKSAVGNDGTFNPMNPDICH